MFQTKDGILFDRKENAELHERYLDLLDEVKQLRNIDEGYYCETQEDFDLLINWFAYSDPYYDYDSDLYKPNYHNYSEYSFMGADWYFFRREVEDDYDYYYVETLSELKNQWDKFYDQFN